MSTVSMRVLVKPTLEGGYYAQVLEFDLAADGRTFDSTLAELSRVINVHVAACIELGNSPFEGLDPAPASYHEAWKHARLLPGVILPELKCITMPPLRTELAVA